MSSWTETCGTCGKTYSLCSCGQKSNEDLAEKYVRGKFGYDANIRSMSEADRYLYDFTYYGEGHAMQQWALRRLRAAYRNGDFSSLDVAGDAELILADALVAVGILVNTQLAADLPMIETEVSPSTEVASCDALPAAEIVMEVVPEQQAIVILEVNETVYEAMNTTSVTAPEKAEDEHAAPTTSTEGDTDTIDRTGDTVSICHSTAVLSPPENADVIVTTRVNKSVENRDRFGTCLLADNVSSNRNKQGHAEVRSLHNADVRHEGSGREMHNVGAVAKPVFGDIITRQHDHGPQVHTVADGAPCETQACRKPRSAKSHDSNRPAGLNMSLWTPVFMLLLCSATTNGAWTDGCDLYRVKDYGSNEGVAEAYCCCACLSQVKSCTVYAGAYQDSLYGTAVCTCSGCGAGGVGHDQFTLDYKVASQWFDSHQCIRPPTTGW